MQLNPTSPNEHEVDLANRALLEAQKLLEEALTAQREARNELRTHHTDMAAIEQKYKAADKKAKASFRVAFALDMVREEAEIGYENALLKAKRLETVLANADKGVMKARRSVSEAEMERVRQLNPKKADASCSTLFVWYVFLFGV